jgi:methylated-DNA-[protein]-cysteine S-methyltransferase
MMGEELRGLVFEVAPSGDPDQPRWGWVGLVSSARGLRLLTLPSKSRELALQRMRRHYADVALAPDDTFLCGMANQVYGYLMGQMTDFAIELDLRGHSTFELTVWAATCRIRYGETRTYGWIAGQVGGGPGTAQAAGAALGNNPVPLVVPCHRVIGSDGSLHGFAGGLDMKRRLLALENQQMSLGLL